jgi:hypothetical protein
MEMELSLMYDILYTKASVTHSWVGYCIRIISPLAVAASLVLFQLSSKYGYSRVDVDITYTLLGGALVLEMKSLLGTLGSIELGVCFLMCHAMGLASAFSSAQWEMVSATACTSFSSQVLAWQDDHDRNHEEVVTYHGAAQHAAVSCRADDGQEESPTR